MFIVKKSTPLKKKPFLYMKIEITKKVEKKIVK